MRLYGSATTPICSYLPSSNVTLSSTQKYLDTKRYVTSIIQRDISYLYYQISNGRLSSLITRGFSSDSFRGCAITGIEARRSIAFRQSIMGSRNHVGHLSIWDAWWPSPPRTFVFLAKLPHIQSHAQQTTSSITSNYKASGRERTGLPWRKWLGRCVEVLAIGD